MSSLTGFLSLAGSVMALNTGFALLLARHRNATGISGAVLFFNLGSALLLLGLFLGSSFSAYPHLIFTQLPLSLCIGPLLLLFVRSAAEALGEFGPTSARLLAEKRPGRFCGTEVARLISAENGFKAFERIGGIALVRRVWGKYRELTGKLSLKRHVITGLYASEIDGIYS